MASIKQRPDGRWRARYRDEADKEHARHFARKMDGLRWLDEVTAAKVSGQYVDPKAGKSTFKSFYTDWSKRQIWQATTVLAVAPGTVRGRFDHVARVFRAAVDDRVIALDPSKGVRLPARRRQEVAMAVPTTAQVHALIEAADDDFAPFIALCAFAGLRLGEAAGVQVGDVDFLRRTLQLTRQVQRASGPNAVEIRSPKYGSERTVFLPDALLSMLSEQIARRGIAGQPDAWLFVGAGSNPPHQNVIWHRWRPVCRHAEVNGVTVHSLRHFYASGLIAAGCDVVTVQRALGHASATVTLRTYAHMWPTAEDKTRAAATELMANAAAADSLRTADGHERND